MWQRALQMTLQLDDSELLLQMTLQLGDPELSLNSQLVLLQALSKLTVRFQWVILYTGKTPVSYGVARSVLFPFLFLSEVHDTACHCVHEYGTM